MFLSIKKQIKYSSYGAPYKLGVRQYMVRSMDEKNVMCKCVDY